MKQSTEDTLKNQIDPKDLMAVERATTALLGTAISLIILGFIIEKFELFLHLISAEIKDKPHTVIPQLSHIAFYTYLGVSIVAIGIMLSLYTYRYYTNWIHHLEHHEINTDKNIYFFLALFIAGIGIVLIASMLLF
jgi:putative membrane protein